MMPTDDTPLRDPDAPSDAFALPPEFDACPAKRPAWEAARAEAGALFRVRLFEAQIDPAYRARFRALVERAERDREGAALGERTERKPPRRPADLSLPSPLPPIDALDAIEDERLPAAVADLAAVQGHFAAMQSYLAARLAEASARKPRWQSVAWAAAQSGLSTHYFYERAELDHPDHLAFLKKRGRAVRVEEAGFRRWFKSR